MGSDSRLCGRCTAIPWKRLLDPWLRPVEKSYFMYHYVGDASPSAECDFCAMLREIALELHTDIDKLFIQADFEEDEHPFYFLRIDTAMASGKNAIRLILESPETVSSHHELPHADHGPLRMSMRRLNVDYVDWKLINSWIRHCYKDPRHFYCRSIDLDIQNVLVIDCISRRIVPLPQGCRYAALSYVWGPTKNHGSASFENKLPSPAPQGIEDAIYCATKLGLFYLWVDRYCIDQTSDDKHLLIQNMDQIYGCASVTIINAAGASAYHGLPGVSSVPRHRQQCITTGGRSLSRLPSSRAEILNSKWASRGWTLQEGLLSNQRLVFTPSHVYFQCKIRHCCEFLPRDFDSLAVAAAGTGGGDLTEQFIRSVQVFEHHARFNPSDWEAVFRDILRQYLQRQLTFESDILLAFVAVFKSLSVHHFWGLPFRSTGKNAHPAATLMKWLLHLPWSSKLTHLVKREGLPSWSWTAWKGLESLSDHSFLLDTTSLEAHVAIEDTSGERFSIADYCSVMEVVGDPSQFRPFLRIDAWVTQVRLWDVAEPTGGSRMRISVTDTGHQFTALAFVTRMILPEEPEWAISDLFVGTWPLLLLVDGKKHQGPAGLNFGGLLLKPCKDGSYQKLGVLEPQRMILERNSEGDQTRASGRIKLRSEQGPGCFECEWRSIVLA